MGLGNRLFQKAGIIANIFLVTIYIKEKKLTRNNSLIKLGERLCNKHNIIITEKMFQKTILLVIPCIYLSN